MKEMLMLLAATMSKEDIIERLTESCAQYNEAKLLNNEKNVKEAEKELFVTTNLFIMNFVTKGNLDNAINTIKEMGEVERAHNFFKTPKN